MRTSRFTESQILAVLQDGEGPAFFFAGEQLPTLGTPQV